MNQTVWNKLRSLGYTGPLDQMLSAYYKANGGSGVNAVGDAKKKSIASLGYTATSVADVENKQMIAGGKAGSISDKRKKLWT